MRSSSLYNEWIRATKDIGGLAWAYAGKPEHWKPAAEQTAVHLPDSLRTRVKGALYKALAALGAAVPVDKTDMNTASEYAALSDPSKALLGEGFADYTENGLSHNAVTHQVRQAD